MGRSSNPTGGFGGVVRELRLELGLTQAAVAKRARVTGSYLARVELGQVHPSMGVVQRIAAALGVSVAALLEARGYVPPEIKQAYLKSPEALLWFCSLSSAERNRLARRGHADDEQRERERIRAISRRLRSV